MPACVESACFCCWSGCDFDNCKIGCGQKTECLCLVQEFCVAAGEDSLGLGCITNADNKEVCKLGLGCLAVGLKVPDKLCAGAGYQCCYKGVQSFPLHKDYVESVVCACCFLSCAPECGCCADAPKSNALEGPLSKYAYDEVVTNAMDR